MRLRAKKDKNHDEIARTFMQLGWSWKDTHNMGDGFPDGIAGKAGINLMVEIKNRETVGRARTGLRDAQVEFHAWWRGPIAVVYTPDEVIALNNEIMRQGRQAGL